MLLMGGPFDPVRLSPGVLQNGLGAFGCEDVGTLPAHLGTERCALCLQEVMNGGSAERPCSRQLTVGPWDRVVQPEDLGDAVVQPLSIPVEGGEAAGRVTDLLTACDDLDHAGGQLAQRREQVVATAGSAAIAGSLATAGSAVVAGSAATAGSAVIAGCLITVLCVNFLGDALRDALDPTDTRG